MNMVRMRNAAVGARRREHAMPFGTRLVPGGGVAFRLFAPAQANMAVAIVGGPTVPLDRDPDGWHSVTTEAAAAGDRYRFMLADGRAVPDPASRYQPDDCNGPSEIVDPRAYVWTDSTWCGRPWHEAIIYELHVGTFTPEGTFEAAQGKLDDLVALGVTAVELMPVADFAGPRNWGYDGVLPFAPDSAYGQPDHLKAFVNAAHDRGLMVLLDVVYNHFGPEGNRLADLVPAYVTDRHVTPWGPGLDFDGEGGRFVRDFFIHNALYWIEEFHLDGLRLDAVHAIQDGSEEHFLRELARRVRAAHSTRDIHLIAENEENAAALLETSPDGASPVLTAQWNDDLHHVLHTAVTREGLGYYADYLDETALLGRTLAEGFAFQGQVMPYRGSARGEPSAHLTPTAFVGFLQNHDQIGNRAFGDRIVSLAPTAAIRAAAAVSLLGPQIPMLFMGEEWGTARPFPFFCGFTGDLATAVRDGRRKEFARFPAFEDPASRDRIPDPTADQTFLSAKLDWSERSVAAHAAWIAWYTKILSVRQSMIVPRLAGIDGHAGTFQCLGHLAVDVRWRLGDGSSLTLRANLKADPQVTGAAPIGDRIWTEGRADGNGCDGWSIAWFLAGASDGLGAA